MNVNILIPISLFIGMIIQFFLTLGFEILKKKNIQKILLDIVICCMFFVLTFANKNPSLSLSIFLTSLVFTFFTIIIFKQQFIFNIDELEITVWTVLFIFFLWTGTNMSTYIKFASTAIGSIIIYVNLGKYTYTPGIKLLLYAWFLFCISATSLFLFPWEIFSSGQHPHLVRIFTQNGTQNLPSLLEYFFLGGFIFYSAMYIIPLIFLFPILLFVSPKSIPTESIRVKKHMEFLSERYISTQYPKKIILGFLILILLSLGINMYLDLLDSVFIVSFWLIIYQIFKKYVKE